MSGLTLQVEDRAEEIEEPLYYTPQACHCLYPIPWSLEGKMDGYGYGQLSWHFTQAPLTFPCSNVMHITYRSTHDHCLSEDKYCTSVLFMFIHICNMGISAILMAKTNSWSYVNICAMNYNGSLNRMLGD